MVVFFQAKRCTLKNIEALLNFKLQPIWITNENNIYETTWSIETSEWFKANIPDLKTYRTYRSRPKFHGVSLSLRSLQREAFQTRVGIPIAASPRWTSRRLGWRFEVRKSVNISFAKNFNTTTLQLYFENKQCSLNTENISENTKQQRPPKWITQMLSCTYMVIGAHPTISHMKGCNPISLMFLPRNSWGSCNYRCMSPQVSWPSIRAINECFSLFMMSGSGMLMEEIWPSPVEVGSLSHHFQGSIHPRCFF